MTFYLLHVWNLGGRGCSSIRQFFLTATINTEPETKAHCNPFSALTTFPLPSVSSRHSSAGSLGLTQLTELLSDIFPPNQLCAVTSLQKHGLSKRGYKRKCHLAERNCSAPLNARGTQPYQAHTNTKHYIFARSLRPVSTSPLAVQLSQMANYDFFFYPSGSEAVSTACLPSNWGKRFRRLIHVLPCDNILQY